VKYRSDESSSGFIVRIKNFLTNAEDENEVIGEENPLSIHSLSRLMKIRQVKCELYKEVIPGKFDHLISVDNNGYLLVSSANVLGNNEYRLVPSSIHSLDDVCSILNLLEIGMSKESYEALDGTLKKHFTKKK